MNGLDEKVIKMLFFVSSLKEFVTMLLHKKPGGQHLQSGVVGGQGGQGGGTRC